MGDFSIGTPWSGLTPPRLPTPATMETDINAGTINTAAKQDIRQSRTFEDYGAVGDGVANDTTAVVNAFAAAGGDAFLLTSSSDKSYVVRDKVIVSSGTTFIGNGCTFIKDYASVNSVSDALFTNENYAVDPTHDTDIWMDSFRIENEGVTDEGAFMSWNWVERLRITNFEMKKIADGWTLHLCGKDVIIANGIIDTVDASTFSDGIHAEYLEDAVITNCVFDTDDDCIALGYQKSSNSSAGPDIASRNITISNCAMRSKIANGVRIGAGELASVVPVVANGVYSDVTVTNCAFYRSGSSGSALGFTDNRTAYAGKHDNIRISDCVFTDPTGSSAMINFNGNTDPQDVTYIADRNFGSITISDCEFTQSGTSNNGWMTGGGIEDVVFRSCKYRELNSRTSNVALVYMIDNLTFEDCDIKSDTTANIFAPRDFKRLRMNRNVIDDFNTGGSVNDVWNLNQPNVTTGDSLEARDNVLLNVQYAVQPLSGAVTLDELWYIGNNEEGVTVAKGVGATVTGTVSHVLQYGTTGSGVAAFLTHSDGTTGGAAAAAGVIRLTIDGTDYDVLHI